MHHPLNALYSQANSSLFSRNVNNQSRTNSPNEPSQVSHYVVDVHGTIPSVIKSKANPLTKTNQLTDEYLLKIRNDVESYAQSLSSSQDLRSYLDASSTGKHNTDTNKNTDGNSQSNLTEYLTTDTGKKPQENGYITDEALIKLRNELEQYAVSFSEPLDPSSYRKPVSSTGKHNTDTNKNTDGNSQSNLTEYLITGTEEKPYLCEFCGNHLSSSRRLREHMAIHTGVKSFKCTTCNKTFATQYRLNRHMRTHTGEKPYTCPICDNSFGKANALTVHMRIHTGEKPYKCDICGNYFRHASTLNGHLITHRVEKPHKCDICGEGFIRESNMKRHMARFHESA